MPRRNAASVLPEPVGAWTSTCSPPAIAGQRELLRRRRAVEGALEPARASPARAKRAHPCPERTGGTQGTLAASEAPSRASELVHHRTVTYSIVARDEETGELGVAVQSRAFNTGAACAWATPGVGAVATQSFTERRYGPCGLDLMAHGHSPRDALDELLREDDLREVRQVAVLDAAGATAAHTGADCIRHAGDLSMTNVSVQGNMLRSDDVWPAMAHAFEATAGTLAERLLAALDAAEAAGGDFRGRQAAGLVVVGGEIEERPTYQRVFDLRVDDHPEPLAELRRLHRLAAAYGAATGSTNTPTRPTSAKRRRQRGCARTKRSSPRRLLSRGAATSSAPLPCSPSSSRPSRSGGRRSSATSGSSSSRPASST